MSDPADLWRELIASTDFDKLVEEMSGELIEFEWPHESNEPPAERHGEDEPPGNDHRAMRRYLRKQIFIRVLTGDRHGAALYRARLAAFNNAVRLMHKRRETWTP